MNSHQLTSLQKIQSCEPFHVQLSKQPLWPSEKQSPKDLALKLAKWLSTYQDNKDQKAIEDLAELDDRDFKSSLRKIDRVQEILVQFCPHDLSFFAKLTLKQIKEAAIEQRKELKLKAVQKQSQSKQIKCFRQTQINIKNQTPFNSKKIQNLNNHSTNNSIQQNLNNLQKTKNTNKKQGKDILIQYQKTCPMIKSPNFPKIPEINLSKAFSHCCSSATGQEPLFIQQFIQTIKTKTTSFFGLFSRQQSSCSEDFYSGAAAKETIAVHSAQSQKKENVAVLRDFNVDLDQCQPFVRSSEDQKNTDQTSQITKQKKL